MPIKAWYCGGCKRAVELTHFADSICGLTTPPGYAAAVLANAVKDREAGVHVTDGLSCPRSRAIERDVDVTVDPFAYNALVLGNAWDAAVTVSKVPVRGIIAGIDITGEIDHLLKLPDELVVADFKHSNNFRRKWITQEGKPADEYVVQTSLYAELYNQTFGERPTRGTIWYHFSGADKAPVVSFTYDLWDLAACLVHKPYNGEYSVVELLRQSADYWGGKSKALDLPLVGSTMSFGSKSYCDYCQVREACFENAYGAPF